MNPAACVLARRRLLIDCLQDQNIHQLAKLKKYVFAHDIPTHAIRSLMHLALPSIKVSSQ